MNSIMGNNTIFDDLHHSGYDLSDAVKAITPAIIWNSVKDACDQVNRLPDEVPLDSPVFRLTSLGRRSREHARDERTPRGRMNCGAIAAAFSAGRKPFSIGMYTSRGLPQCDVLIQAEDLNLSQATALFDGVYGSAQLEESGGPHGQKRQVTRHLTCSRAVWNDKQPEQTNQPEESWITRLSGALIGKSCFVRLVFAPVQGEWIEEQIQRTMHLMDELSGYRKGAIQFSVSDNFSNEHIKSEKNLPGSAMQFIKESCAGKPEENEYRKTGDSRSASRTLERENTAIVRAYELLGQNLTRLDWMRRSGAWSISAWVSADSNAECEIATRLLNTAFLDAGFRCDAWTSEVRGLSVDSRRMVSAVLPVNELGLFFLFPQEDIPGFRRMPLTEYEINPPVRDERKASGEIGRIVWHDSVLEAPFAIPYDELNRHAFICGMTGSGKTNTVCMLLKNSAGGNRAARIPFMVIEPVKGEYRTLKASVPDLQICTMEAGSGEQLFINPFWFPEGGSLQYHIDSLRAVIASAFELTAAMPNILEQCLTNVYIKLGWNVAQGTNIYRSKLREEMLYPTFDMLCNEIDSYLNTSDYSDELRGNYKGALAARLRSFTSGTKGMLLNQQVIPPFMDWIEHSRSCVIELEALADDADKAIVMGVMLSQYFQCVKIRGGKKADGIRHLIVLEEAHHLFKETSHAGSSEGNVSRQHLVEMLSNMLAEIRAYGEGIFIVDQSPTSISAQVVKNTAVKIVHRVDYGEDLRVLQHALLLDDKDMQAPAQLRCGHALIRFGSMTRPMHVSIAHCEEKEESVLGGPLDMHRDGLVSQHLLDMIQSSSELTRTTNDLLLKLLNHLLFDERTNTGEALHIVKEKLVTEFRLCGIEEKSIQKLTPEHDQRILSACMYRALLEHYPQECHLRGKLQMLAERYLELQLGRPDGVRPVEWEAMRVYCQNEIYPMIAYNSRNSVNLEERRIANMFNSNVRSSLAGILTDMAKCMNGIDARGDDGLMGWTADEAIANLCMNDFLCMPAISGVLWDMFQLSIR